MASQVHKEKPAPPDRLALKARLVQLERPVKEHQSQ
jgi:hypothetical protein